MKGRGVKLTGIRRFECIRELRVVRSGDMGLWWWNEPWIKVNAWFQ